MVGLSIPLEEPTINYVKTKEGMKWRVCGLGYCTEHGQRWQAEILHECLMISKGLRDKPASSGG